MNNQRTKIMKAKHLLFTFGLHPFGIPLLTANQLALFAPEFRIG